MKKLLPILLLLLLAASRYQAAATIIYVDSAATGTNSGSSWASAYTSLTVALADAAAQTATDSIFIAQGTYKPVAVGGSNAFQDSTFGIYRGGVRLYGGFSTGGGVRNAGLYLTRLSGNIGTVHSVHVLMVAGLSATADSIIIDGLTVQGGTATTTGTSVYNGITVPRCYGGGISIQSCANGGKTIVRNCRIMNNTVKSYTTGNGIGASVFHALGGGVIVANSSPTLANCVFTGNTAQTAQYTDPLGQITVVTAYGSALCLSGSGTPTIVNCTFYSNTGGYMAPIANNLATTSITNCIIYGNTFASADVVNYGGGTGTISVSYSIVEHGYAGTGNSTSNPLFLNAAGGNLRLQPGSPAIDSGSNAALPAFATTDADGAARIYNNTVDQGAYEFSGGTFITGPLALCTGQSATYAGYVAGGTFSTTNSSLATINSVTGAVSAIAAGVDTIIYTVGGQTAYVPVNINATPVAGNITPAAPACPGDSVFFSGSAGGGSWYSSASAKLTINPNTGHARALGSGPVTVYHVFSNLAGCRDTAQLSYTILPKPIAGTISPTAACAGDTIYFTGSTLGGVWMSGNPAGLSIDPVTGVGLGLMGDSVMVYHVVSNSNGCTDTAQQNVNIHPKPAPVVTFNSGTLWPSGLFTTYSWMLNGTPIPGANAQTYVPTVNGGYTLTVTNSWGCSGTSPVLNVSGLTVSSAPMQPTVNIYPNPVAGLLRIDAAGVINVRVFSIDGRVVFAGLNIHALDFSLLPAGVYRVAVYDDAGVLVKAENIVKEAR